MIDAHAFVRAWREASAHAIDAPVMLLAAHPDDETIGCGGALGRLANAAVVHVTDGVPEDVRYARDAGFSTREDYRRTRIEEARRALDLAGCSRVSGLDGTDQRVTTCLVSLARTLAERLDAERPSVLVTHAYEGGHPDHDATRYVAGAAIELLRRDGAPVPVLLEMTGYHHAGDGALAVGRFTSGDGVELRLDTRELARRFDMLASYPSQESVLAPFHAVRDERIRPAAPVDFSRPPHEGKLWYEHFDWGTTGAEFRAAAHAASVALGLSWT